MKPEMVDVSAIEYIGMGLNTCMQSVCETVTCNLNCRIAMITCEFSLTVITIGPTETHIVVSEGAGFGHVCAMVTDGDLERPVLVILDLNPSTAMCKF